MAEQRYYNYYTGEYVSSPDLIKPRTGMGGPESGGEVIQTEASPEAARQARMDELKAEREKKAAADAEARAASNPLFDPTNRPEAPQLDDGFIRYYSWIGGGTTGQWKLYKEPSDSPKAASAEARSEGGATQAQFGSSAGANALASGGDGTTGSPIAADADSTLPDVIGPFRLNKVTGQYERSDGSDLGNLDTTGVRGSDSTTLALVKSLQDQIAALTQKTTTAAVDTAKAERQSAFEALRIEMAAIGLEALVEPLRNLIEKNVAPSEFAIRLRESEAYKKRFAANDVRIKKGLRVLNPGEYLRVEDAYRQTLRTYGLRQFDNDEYVKQFIENDISAAELSDRVSMAVQRVQNADPAIARTLKDYYGIDQATLVGYVLDPNQQLQKIQRQVAAAEIGTAARLQGIQPGVAVAEQLAAQGITEAMAQKGYATIADILPTSEKLSQIYKGVEEEYGLAESEQEVFNSLASAQRKRQRLIGREVAGFSGQSGLGRGSLGTSTGGQY